MKEKPTAAFFPYIGRKAAVFIKKLLVKRRVEGVEILRVKAVGGEPEGFTEALVMHDFPCAEEFDRVADVGVVAHTENVAIGRAGFLFRGEVFVKVGDRVALGLHGSGCPGESPCRCGVNAGRVIDIIRREAGIHYLFAAEIPRELMHDRADHLKMSEFFRAYRGHSI